MADHTAGVTSAWANTIQQVQYLILLVQFSNKIVLSHRRLQFILSFGLIKLTEYLKCQTNFRKSEDLPYTQI